jgi:peptidoglycan/LPS O-acetylase OafA/YrhL/putative flippase GtrA
LAGYLVLKIRSETRQFLRFCVVGGAGFVIDAGLLALVLNMGLGLGPLVARLISVVVAVIATFLLNRLWAFHGADKGGAVQAFALYVAVQGVGLLCNLAIYTGLVLLAPPPLSNPIVAVAIASALALVVNYLGARHIVFSEGNRYRGAIMSRGSIGIAIVLAAIALSWPSLFNRTPFVFFDTSHYLEIGKAISARLPIVKKLTLAPSTEANPTETAPAAPAQDPGLADGQRDHPALSYAGGRSAFYSVFLYIAIAAAGLWGVAALQALVAAVLLWRLACLVDRDRPARSLAILVVGVGMATALPFYLGMAMPDVFAGLGLLALLLLVIDPAARRPWTAIWLVAICAWSALSHASTIVVLAAALIIGLGFAALFLRVPRRVLGRVALLGAAPLIIAVAGNLAYVVGAKVMLGAAPKSPPYLMARVIADGPGRTYLETSCATEQKFALCSFKDRAFVTQDDFLWSGDPKIGVFSIVDYATRTRLQAEELPFVTGAILSDPWRQVRVSAQHFVAQIAHFGVALEFGTAALSWDTMSFDQLLPNIAASYRAGLAYQGRFPFAAFDLLQVATTCIAFAFLLWRLTRGDIRQAVAARTMSSRSVFAVIAATLFCALLFNAAFCGILSGVNDRYQARVIWLLPLLAMAGAIRFGLSEPRSPDHHLATRSNVAAASGVATSVGDRLNMANGYGPGFDTLRLVLCMSVVLFHSPVVLGQLEMVEQGPFWLAARALVPAFFALSGFLVAGSGTRLSTRPFLINRATRILPALAVEVALSALILGPLFTEEPLKAYFSDPQFARYFLNVIGWIHYELPGVFLHNPSSGVVNVSLWTVPYELCCYAVVMTTIIALGGLRQPMRAALIAGAYAVAMLFVASFQWVTGSAAIDKLTSVLFYSRGSLAILCFVLGATAYAWRGRLPHDPRIALSCTAVLLFATAFGRPWPLGVLYVPVGLSLTYLVVFLGVTKLPLAPIFRNGDYSYGIYLYGYPVQQAIVAAWPSIGRWWVVFLISAPLVTILAMLSWRFVEKPLLHMRRKHSMYRSKVA